MGKTLTLAQVGELLECEVVVEPGPLAEIVIAIGAGADLMSDVLAFINPQALLLTGLTDVQAVRTAIIADVRAMVYVRSKRPSAESIALAQREDLPLLQTPLTMFESCGRLYQAGLPGCVLEPRGVSPG